MEILSKESQLEQIDWYKFSIMKEDNDDECLEYEENFEMLSCNFK